MIKSTKPIICLDIETTSLDVSTAMVVEVCVTHVNFKDCSYKTLFDSLINPGVSIPQDAVDVHGITNNAVANAPRFIDVAEDLEDILAGCDLLGFNIEAFDLPVLWEEFYRCGIVLDLTNVRVFDACSLFRNKEPRTLEAAVEFYTGEKFASAHRAKQDAEATIDVFKAQLERYQMLGLDPDQAAKECRYGDKVKVDLAGKIVLNRDGEEVWSFGKYNGERVIDNIGYAKWVLGADFSDNVKMHVRRIIGC